MKAEPLMCRIVSVADWLTPHSKVQLPVLQRGFVWKTSQIECLWDSIFRGYPIGSMILSRSGDYRMLIDGQQRATSIALGFYNPWNNMGCRIGNATDLPVVWVDVCPREMTTDQKYVFRAVTRAHPWGYQCRHNRSVLSVNDRRKASEMYHKLYGQKLYSKLLPTQRFPYDATCPVPLCFVLNAAMQKGNNVQWLMDECKRLLPKEYRTSGMKEDETYFSLLESADLTSLLDVVKETVLQTDIPAIDLPKELLIDSNDTSANESTLFVRLNRQGTPIDGEELMFSMFKSACPQTKELVECLGLNIIPPSRVITLTSRLILSESNYVAGISLAQFRKYVHDDGFIRKMINLIGTDGHSPIREKIEQAIGILRYGNVPDVVVKKYIRSCPNGFLLLLHWLFENNIESIDEIRRKQIAFRLYRNHWFGTDFDFFVKNNWNNVSQPDFWDDRYFVNEGWIRQFPLMDPSLLLDFLTKGLDNPIENHEIRPDMEDGLQKKIWQQWQATLPRPENISDNDYNARIMRGWQIFCGNYIYGRDKSLILIAQRNYINRAFADFNQLEDLEDTNTPWDWDHIYPNSWVYRQWNIDPRTKNWEQRIGNFRAMSLTDNRSENANLSPAERFKTPSEDYFVNENDLAYWQLLTQDHACIKDNDLEYVHIHAMAIITRMVNIYAEFLRIFQ